MSDFKVDYKKPKMSQYIRTICDKFDLDYGHVRAVLQVNHPELFQKEHCANCNASMKVEVYRADVFTAILLLKTAEVVRHNVSKGMNFTEANMVHVPTLPTTDAIRHRTTIARYLNYMQQPKTKRNSGYWVITHWGWKALRGDPVPHEVKIFRKKLVERSDSTTTLAGMFRDYEGRVEQSLERRQAVENDYRADVRTYDPIEWVKLEQYAGANLEE